MKRLALRDSLLAKLSEAQKRRDELNDDVATEEDRYPVLRWIVHERETMLRAVNEERATIGKNPVTLKDVYRVEQSACGHSDYSSKFALYCAELVLDKP